VQADARCQPLGEVVRLDPLVRKLLDRCRRVADVCRSCKAPLVWVQLPSGSRAPLDVEELEAPAVNLVARKPGGKGLTLDAFMAERARTDEWAAQGITFHTNHFATCPFQREVPRWLTTSPSCRSAS
jgi:hypothetical protein